MADRQRLRVWGFEDAHACGYYRIRLPYRAGELWGDWDARTHHGWTDECRDYPIIAGQRVGRFGMTGIWRRLRATNKLVWECDDDLWTIDPTNLVAHLSHNDEVQDAIDQCIRASHLVTVSTHPLAEVLRRRHDNVVVLPNHVDPELLDLPRRRNPQVTVGWSGGDSHYRDIELIAPALRRVQQSAWWRDVGAQFHMIGTDYRRAFGLSGRWTGWQRDIWSYYRAVDFDISLAPLADTIFNVSKSAVRAIEHGALGIPVIASAVGPYADYIRHGETGFLVRRRSDWEHYLKILIADPEQREAMGKLAKEEAARWTVRDGWKLWDAAYRSLL